MQRQLGLACFLGSVFCTSAASAHLTLTNPPARHPADDLKQGPCGVGVGDARTTDQSKITTYMAGETITVEWTEVIDHDPSHYRIAFSFEGDDFVDPVGFDDQETVFPELLDGIPDADAGPGHQYSVQVTLPNEPCDLCSLQVIQVMHDKPPWGPEGGDDIYYQCADIVILENPSEPMDPDPMDPDPMDPDPMDPPPGGDGGSPSMVGDGGSPSSGGTLMTGGTPDLGTGGTSTDPAATGGMTAPQEETTSSSGDAESAPGCALSPGSNLPPASTRTSAWALLLAAGALLGRTRRRTQGPRN